MQLYHDAAESCFWKKEPVSGWGPFLQQRLDSLEHIFNSSCDEAILIFKTDHSALQEHHYDSPNTYIAPTMVHGPNSAAMSPQLRAVFTSAQDWVNGCRLP